MVPAGPDEWLLEYDWNADEHPDDQFEFGRIVLWLLVEHQFESGCDADGTPKYEWTQFTVEPWMHQHLDWWESLLDDDFGCAHHRRDRRVCGPHAELMQRRAELRQKRAGGQ